MRRGFEEKVEALQYVWRLSEYSVFNPNTTQAHLRVSHKHDPWHAINNVLNRASVKTKKVRMLMRSRSQWSPFIKFRELQKPQSWTVYVLTFDFGVVNDRRLLCQGVYYIYFLHFYSGPDFFTFKVRHFSKILFSFLFVLFVLIKKYATDILKYCKYYYWSIPFLQRNCINNGCLSKRIPK